jgi:hypothetical protein
MDKKATTSKATVETVVIKLVKIASNSKVETAKELHKAQGLGFKPSQIARQWEGKEGALNEDTISKYLIAYGASLKGADFAKVLGQLNTGELSRKVAVAWEAEDVPEDMKEAPSKSGKSSRGESDPKKASQKALDAIISRVKSGKLNSREAQAMLNTALGEVNTLVAVNAPIAAKNRAKVNA